MSISNAIQVGANYSKDYLVGITKYLNNDTNPGLVDLFMDEAKGRGHRIVSGHDFSYLPEVYEKFGLSGVADYFKHLSKDVMSPDGIPVPFASKIQESLNLTTMQSIDWLCLNIGDILSGGFSVWHTRETIIALQAGNLSDDFVVKLLIGSGLKVYLSIHSPNPISLACGLVDLGALAYYSYPAYSQFVAEALKPDLAWKEIAGNSLQATGVGFIGSFTYRSLQNIQELIQKNLSPKEYFKEITRQSVVDGAISGTASVVSDLTEKYLGFSRGPKTAVAVGSFLGLRVGYNKLKKHIGRPQQSDMIVNEALIPSYGFSV